MIHGYYTGFLIAAPRETGNGLGIREMRDSDVVVWSFTPYLRFKVDIIAYRKGSTRQAHFYVAAALTIGSTYLSLATKFVREDDKALLRGLDVEAADTFPIFFLSHHASFGAIAGNVQSL